MAGLTVQLDAGELEGPVGAVVGGEQSLFDGGDEHLEAEVSFPFQRP